MLRLKVRRSKLAQQPSQLAPRAWLHTGGVDPCLEMGENESSAPSVSQQGKRVQPASCSWSRLELWGGWRQGCSLHVGACFAVSCCSKCCRSVCMRGCVFACVLGKGGNPCPSFLQYVAFEKTLHEFRRVREGLIRSCKPLALLLSTKVASN